MSRHTLIILAFFTSCTASLNAGDDAKREAVQKEWKRLEGTWEAVSAVVDGAKQVPRKGKGHRLVIRVDTYALEADGKPFGKGTLKLDPTAKPPALDFIPAEGPSKGKSVPSIYELKGDELRVCMGRIGGKRPTELTAEEDSKRILTDYRRVKPTESGEEAVEKELKRLEGTWEEVSVVIGGKKLERPEAMRTKLVVREDGYTLKKGGNVLVKGTLKVELSRKPKELTLTAQGRNAFEGIYELKGDELRLCSSPTALLPRELSSTEDDGRTLTTYRRAPPKKKSGEGPVQKELKQLEGIWWVASLEPMNRKGLPPRMDLGHVVIRGDGSYTVQRWVQVGRKGMVELGSFHGTFKVDPAKQPKSLDITLSESEKQPPTLAIYELKGDELRICNGSPGEVRPAQFIADDTYTIITYRRVKSKE